jgi:hypothetical protein
MGGGNELDIVAVAGLELDVDIEPEEVCNEGGRNGVEVDISTWVGKGNTKGNWYAPLSLPSNFFVDPGCGERGSPSARVQMLTWWSRNVSDSSAR